MITNFFSSFLLSSFLVLGTLALIFASISLNPNNFSRFFNSTNIHSTAKINSLEVFLYFIKSNKPN